MGEWILPIMSAKIKILDNIKEVHSSTVDENVLV